MSNTILSQLDEAQKAHESVTLRLSTGDQVTGRVHEVVKDTVTIGEHAGPKEFLAVAHVVGVRSRLVQRPFKVEVHAVENHRAHTTIGSRPRLPRTLIRERRRTGAPKPST